MPKSTISSLATYGALACLSVCLLGPITGCGETASQPGATGAAQATEVKNPPPPPALSQTELEELYRASKARFEATTELPEQSFSEIQADLTRVANEGEDVHLRANASLLLGAMHELRDDQRAAISFYRQAKELIPGEVAPYIVLALALSKDKKWEQAIVEQWIVVEMIPDDLVGWLLLGEFHVKGGKLDEATNVYGAYELRRKGLLDGLTLKSEGEYIESEAERAACAEALAPAVDNGTALALMYALDSDPAPVVRERVAAIMGEQRLLGYQKLLESKLASEQVVEVKQAIEWALAEIGREPIETAPGPIPEEIAKQVEAEVEARAKAAAEKGAEGEGAEGEGAEDKAAGGGEAPAGGGEAPAGGGEAPAAEQKKDPPAAAPAPG